jgi:hypothetical protein
MAKAAQRSGEAESVMGYFRPILEANPELIKQRRNDELYDRWLQDHPQQKTVPENVKNGLSNLKASLRRKLKLRKGKRRQKVAAAAEPGATPVKRAPRGAAGQMERLEEQIDECVAMARSLDREGLGKVIDLLRGARNQVVVQALR